MAENLPDSSVDILSFFPNIVHSSFGKETLLFVHVIGYGILRFLQFPGDNIPFLFQTEKLIQYSLAFFFCHFFFLS